MAKSVASLLTIVGFSLFEVGTGNAFLRIKPNSESGHVFSDNLERTLLEEIEGQVGNANIRGRLARLESALHPMFLSLPKNEHGNLDHATVRYALHRLFVQRHGWYIKGLDNAGGHRNTSSSAGLLKEQVPAYIQDLFEQRLGGRGFGLHELGVLAATIEHLVHSEAIKRLGQAFKVHNFLPTSGMSVSDANDVL